MSALSLWRLAIRRLAHRRLLTSLVLLSTALAIGIVAAVPIFAGGVSLRIMQEELGLLEGPVRRSPYVVRFYAYPTARQPLDIDSSVYYRDWLANLLARHVRVPIQSAYIEVHSPRWELLARSTPDAYSSESRDSVYVVYAQDVGQHITITDGSPFGRDVSPGVLDVWIERDYADEEALAVGDVFELGDRYTGEGRVPMRIAGIWEAADPENEFWRYRESIWHYEGILLTSAAEYAINVYPMLPIRSQFISWLYVLDDTRIDLGHGERYVEGLQDAQREAAERLPGGTMDEAPTLYFIRGQARKTSLTIVLLGFVVPLMGIVVYLLGALSSLVVSTQRQEIAMLNSRGASRTQIMALGLVESLILVIVAIPPGLLIGLLLASALGHAESFMRFGQSDALTVSIHSADWRLIAAATAITGVARLAPTWRAAGLTTVSQERQSARGRIALGAARWMLIFALVAMTRYAYQRLAAVGSLGLLSWPPSDSAWDPLLLLAPALFLLIAPILAAELYLALARPIAWMGSLAWHPSLYLGTMNLGNDAARYRSSVYMLVLCLGLGVFYASLAKSADAWQLDRRRYQIGADLVFHPRGTGLVAGRFARLDPDLTTDAPPSEMPFLVPVSAYQRVPGVDAVSPVGELEAATIAGRDSEFVRLLAIDRLSLPEVTFFREDYAAEPLGSLMNRLGTCEDAILLPSSLAEVLQLGPGDKMLLNVLVSEDTRAQIEFTVVGTFDYFPTMLPDEALVCVTNLDYIQFQTAGIVPYALWMRTAEGSDGAELARRITNSLQIIPEYIADLGATLAEDSARIERQGIYGVLTICFLTGALLSALGLLMHSMASLQAGSLHYAILQALGLARRQVLGAVFVEYSLVLGYSVLAGLALGILGAQAYVPHIQLTEHAQPPVPPYLALYDHERAILLTLVMLASLAVVQLMVITRLAHTRIFEVLRLGTRE